MLRGERITSKNVEIDKTLFMDVPNRDLVNDLLSNLLKIWQQMYVKSFSSNNSMISNLISILTILKSLLFLKCDFNCFILP